MKTLLRGSLLALMLAMVLPQQAEAQTIWDRARDALEEAERERGTEARDRDARTDRDQTARDRAAREEAARRDREREAARQRGTSGDYGRTGPQGRRGAVQTGPPFCRNGSGHPVHGMRWCYDKGYAGPAWSRGSLGSVVLDRRQRQRSMDRATTGRNLDRLLGRETSRRAQEYARDQGLAGRVAGQWVNATTFELAADGRPFARLVDRTGNGRVDVTMLARYR